MCCINNVLVVHACMTKELLHAKKAGSLKMQSLPVVTQSDEEDLEDGPKGFEAAQVKKGLLGPKKEADYDFFVDVMWPKISTKEEKQRMTPNLVYQVPQHCLSISAAMSTSSVLDCCNNSLLLLQACELKLACVF